jgi:alpha-galactosidase
MVGYLVTPATCLDNGVGVTPAMGWNSWNRFRCEGLDEKLILEVAQAMVSSGLRDAGYKYVNIDDCWQEKRGADGHIVPFQSKFPSGMKALGDKIHALGLRFGIYSCAGERTCEGWPGSYGYETTDAADYASWGVDYLKYDFCGFEKVAHQKSPRHYYSVMRDALNATGRPILFSMCNWGVGQPHLWGESQGGRWVNTVGNSWRTGRDVFAAWDEHAARAELHLPGFLQSIETAVEQQAAYGVNAGPGSFNDPDMLVVGLDSMTPYGIVEECPTHLPAGSCKKGDYVSRELWGKVGGLTITEQRAQFSFWSMLAAPLMLGNDPRTMTSVTKRILTSPELIAINQDPLGIQATRVLKEEIPVAQGGGSLQVWVKRLWDGSHAVLLFNGGQRPSDVTVRWDKALPEAAKPYGTDVEREPPCANKHDDAGCATWQKGGECTKNPGFMKSNCMKACGACPPALYEGKQAAALVRNAWEAADEGVFVALYTARHVEAHEARVVTVRFGHPDVLARRMSLETMPLRSMGGASGGGGTAHGRAGDAVVHEDLSHQHTPHSKAPPTLSACAAEHSDSLLLGTVCIAVTMGLLLLGLGRLLGREIRRSRVNPWKGAKDTRPHAV